MRYASTYGEALDHLVERVADGKGYDKNGDGNRPTDWRERAEEEIDAMSNTELLMLLWEAELLKVPS